MLFLSVPPTLRVEPEEGRVVARAGATVALQCRVTAGNPAPEVRWRRRNDRLPATARLRDSGATLEMPSVGRHHAGVYECEADNGVGRAAGAAVELSVLCE